MSVRADHRGVLLYLDRIEPTTTNPRVLDVIHDLRAHVLAGGDVEAFSPTTKSKESTMHTKPYKAVAGFVLTFLAALIASVQGRPTLDGMGVLDWGIVIGGALVVAGGVYGITNPPANNGPGA